MAELNQDFNGKWNITGLKHNGPADVSIPASYTYNGITKTINITSSEQTVQTDWKTRIGEAINLNDVRRTYGTVSQGDTTYTAVDNFASSSVHPVPGASYTLEVSGPTSIANGGSGNFSAVYILKVNNVERARQTVTSDAAWSMASGAAYASVNAGRVTNNNSGSGDQQASVRATFNNISGTASFTAEGTGGPGPEPVTTYELIVTATSYVIENEGELQFSAYYITKVGGQETNRQNVTNNSNTTWRITAGQSYAIVNTTGKVTNQNTAEDDKTATVEAEYNGKSASHAFTAKGTGDTPHVTTFRLDVTPTTKTIEASGEGSTVQLTATFVTLVDNVEVNTEDVTHNASTQWSSTNTSWATVSGGLVQGVNRDTSASHTATIKATYNGTTGSSAVTVKAYVEPATDHKLEVTPSPAEIDAEGTVQLTAKYYSLVGGSWDDGEDVTLQANWNVSNGTNYATVGNYSGNKGFVQGTNDTYNEQIVTVTASCCGYTDDATVVVSAKEGPEPEHYYILRVTPEEESIDWNGSVQLHATLYTYVQGQTTPVGQEEVTTTCDWHANTTTAVSVGNGSTDKGFVQGINNLTDEVSVNVIAEKTLLGGNSATGSAVIHVGGRPEAHLNIDVSNIDSDCGEVLSVTREITADADLTWKATAVDVEHIGYDVEWVTVTPTTGQGNGSITIVINSENTGKTTRDCFVRVRYPADSDTFKSITVTQAPKPRFVVSCPGITVPQEGTMGINVTTCESSHHLSLSNDGNDWIAVEEVETTTGYTAKVVVNTEATSARTGSITISSTYDGDCTQFNSVTVPVSQTYTPPVDPTYGRVRIYDTETSTDEILTKTCSAAAQDVTFWVSCLNNYRVVQIGEGVTLKKSNGDVVSVQDEFAATGADHRVRFYATVPRNSSLVDGVDYQVRFAPVNGGQTNTLLTIKQRKNEIWHDNYTIFIAENGSDLDVDEINIPAIGAYYTPYVWIRAERHEENNPNPSTPVYDTMTDYVSNAGVLDGEERIDGDTTRKITINVTGAGAVVSKDTAHSGPYMNCSVETPYEIYIPENRSSGGQPRDYVMTLTYYPAGASMVTKSFTMHQAWSEPPHMPTDMHTLSGCTGNIIQVTSAVTTASVNGAITLECNSGSVWVGGGDAGGCEIAIGGEYSKFEIGGGIQFGVPFTLADDATGITFYFTNKAPAGSSYTITINCTKSGKDTTIILITVTSV